MSDKKTLFINNTEVEFTDECIEEIVEFYEYISNDLKENNSAKTLITEVTNRILNLENAPELYMKIGKTDGLKREYHRIVVKNYVVLYTIDFEKKKVFISRMIYGKRNYLNIY